MAEYIRKCKYCESNVRSSVMCSACKTKLLLIRQLLWMVKNAKAKVAHGNTIRIYLKESV